MREGFEMATSANLPMLSSIALCSFINEKVKVTFESSDAKLQRSAQAQYGDQSIGFVELKRENNLVKVYAKVTPEHKVRGKSYTVYVEIDEKRGQILEGHCEDCPAAQGGCKHLVAFLCWIHRRSEEPSPTDVACYWKKSKLSTVVAEKFISLKDFCGEKYVTSPPGSSNFLEEFKNLSIERGVSNMISSLDASQYDNLSLHFLKYSFEKEHGAGCQEFLNYCKSKMTVELCKEAQEKTINQACSKLWYELRYGRITASVLHDAAHCSTDDGSLVNKILGSKIFTTDAMKRGKLLEDSVIKATSKLLKIPLKKCGIFLNVDLTVFGASPDALGNDFVVEIKCPTSHVAFSKYILSDGTPAKKYFAQLQLQMLFSGFNRGLFVVAHPDYEETKKIEMVWVDIDYSYLNDILKKAMTFWGNYIYKHL